MLKQAMASTGPTYGGAAIASEPAMSEMCR